MSKHIYNVERSKSDIRDFAFEKIVSPVTGVKLPSSVDLRSSCPPVYDQGNLGSCTAFTGCSCLAMVLNKKLTDFSELYLYYWERYLSGTVSIDSGAIMRDIGKALQKYGCCEESYVPYDIKKFKTKPSEQSIKNAENYKIKAYHSVSKLEGIQQSLALRQKPVMIGMDVFPSFESEAVEKTGKMVMPGKRERSLGGHACLVVGYQNSTIKSIVSKDLKGILIVRNSWSEQWGDKGYFYMPYDYVTKGYAFDFWTIDV
jgi:C1A family cysteine protease